LRSIGSNSRRRALQNRVVLPIREPVSDRAPTSALVPPVEHSNGVAAGGGAASEETALEAFTAGSVGSVLRQLAERRASGLLRIGAVGEVWLDEGRVYLANGPESPPLFEVLYAADIADPERLRVMCDEADRGGGTVLDRLAAVDPGSQARVRRMLYEHVQAALFELMVPSTEPLEFEAGAHHVLGARFGQPADELLDVVQRRVELWRRIAELIPSTASRFRLSGRLPSGRAELVVTADEWPFVALLDGRRTVAELITETGDSAFRVCSLLYRLLLEGVIEPVEGR
jgi:hypothetical protein